MTQFLSLAKTRSVALIAIAALAAAALAGGSPAASSNQFTIQLSDNGPDPAQLTITMGDSVTFTNTGGENHDVLMANANYTGPLLHPGDSTTLQLKTVGKYPYTETGFSHPHHGTIIVTASASSGTPLTLSGGAGLVVFGAHATLQGKSTMPAGTQVALYAHPGSRAPNKCSKNAAAYAQAGWLPVGSASAVGADGTFSFVVSPTVSTMYRAVSTDGQTCSSAVQMQVRPVVTIHRSAAKAKTGQPVAITGSVRPAAATSSLTLMSYDRVSKTWRKVATTATSKAGTAHFSFLALQGPTRLHVATAAKGGGHGSYLDATSPSVVVTGVGAAPAPARHAKHAKHKKKH
jgi:plastocyanin